MSDDMFERVRRRRRQQLADAARTLGERFNPFQSGPILGLKLEQEEDPSGSTLTIYLEGGKSAVFPHFYSAHAAHMEGLVPLARIEYLRSIWLNYSRRVHLRSQPEA